MSRKGNWSEKEDQLLTNKVIQYARAGKTQLEAFKDAAEELKRTSAACGYRWNAKLRNNFQGELKQAKQVDVSYPINKEGSHKETETPLQLALQYLEYLNDYRIHSFEDIRELSELKKENEQLKRKLTYFEQAYFHAFPSKEKV